MEKDIAKKIIDKYEKSSKSNENVKEGNMSINFLSFEEYNKDSNFKYRILINEAAVRFERIKLVSIKWISKDNIIERISFKLEDIDQFYDIAEVERKSDILNNVLNELEFYEKNIKYINIKNMISDLKKQLLEKHKIPKLIEDNEKRNLILNALKGIDEILNNQETIYERVFSKKYLGNSKKFEKHLRANIVSLIKKYFSDISELDDDQILNSIGIEKTTNELHIKGDVRFMLNNKSIDLCNFIYGIALNSQTIKELDLIDFNFNKVISVENKANFNYLCSREDNALIIFSSGFYSPSQKRFLNSLYRKIIETNDKIEFYHWGDIDLGGINIYKNIKRYIFNNVKPYLMDTDIMEENIDYCENIDKEKYIQKLKKLLEDDYIKEMHDVIKFVIERRLTLEQESLIF